MTQNALTPITSNTLAKAEDVMGNFEYLDGKITQYVAVIEDKADADTVSSQIATLSSSISNISGGMSNYLQKTNVTSKGSASKPVYFNSSGVAQECTGLDGSLFGNNIGVITEKYSNGASGYVIFSNRFCIQWGFNSNATARNTNYEQSLLKAYADTNYNIIITPKQNGATSTAEAWGENTTARTVSTFYIIANAYGAVTCNGVHWLTIGYLASEE